MEKPKEKKPLFKNRPTEKPKSSGLRSGRNGHRGINLAKKDVDDVPKENPLLSQAPEGSKTWNSFKSITKITQVKPSEYTPIRDVKKKPDYINFRNW